MDRRELETAAARGTYLRGLTAVPLGVLFLVTGSGNLGWEPIQEPVVFLACLAVLAAAYAGIMRHYNTHYGRVRLAKTVSWQERSRNTRCMAVTVWLTAQAEANGP